MKGMDRISQLPEPILQHIQSFLFIKDAAKTSILSKVWYTAWTSLSCLDFGDKYFNSYQLDNIVYPILESRKTQKISIQRFRIMLWSHCLTSEFAENMINLLVACNIKELFLDIIQGINKFPEAIFAAKALNVLRLRGFELELPSDGIKFSSLRELHLEYSLLDEQLLQALFASCNDLEVLSLRFFHGLTSLQVAGTLPKLRMVKLERCPPRFHSVNIVAPNLRDLHISSLSQNIDVIKITACKSLKKLHLRGVAVTDDWVEHLFSCLPNLESVDLVACASLKTMKIFSDHLKHLHIHFCHSLSLVDLRTPNLLRFSGHVYEIERFPTFRLKASPLLEAVLNLHPRTVDTNWYCKLTDSLGNFNHSRAIVLHCYRNEVIVIPKGMRANLLPPLHGTKRLHVNTWRLLNVDVLDSMLWISPQLDTLSFGLKRGLKTLKFIYKDATDEDAKPCCAHLPWKCWRHELKKVKLQNFTCEELHELRDYFHTNTDTLEIIEVPPECSF